jgi:enoyl-CoA hydratase/carnithine racemase
MTETILAEMRGAILLITLNKPQKLNAIDAGMLAEIAAQLARADADDGVAASIITGVGRSFSTGFDMSTGGSPDADTTSTVQRLRANFEHFRAIWAARKPVIAAVDGYALGAGCILANLCDLIFASERATFGEPEIRYWNPATITILPWIVGIRRAKEILYFGRTLDAQTARDYGMVNEVVPVDGFLDAVLRAVAPLTHMHPVGLSALKHSINGGAEIAGFLDALSAGLEEIAPLYAPDSPTAEVYRRQVQELGFKGYIKHRDALFKG